MTRDEQIYQETRAQTDLLLLVVRLLMNDMKRRDDYAKFELMFDYILDNLDLARIPRDDKQL